MTRMSDDGIDNKTNNENFLLERNINSLGGGIIIEAI